MVVVDASAIVNLVTGVPGYQTIGDRLLDATVVAHAPHNVDVEVVSCVRRLELRSVLDATRARAAIDLHRALRIERHSHGRLVPRMWQLRYNLTATDAAYVALAEALDAPLLTCDRRLAASTGHQARIELV